VSLLALPKLVQASWSPEYQLAYLRFEDPSQLQKWISSGLDVWHVEGNTALVALESRLDAFQAEGVVVEELPTIARASFPACYRTYEDMLVYFHEREAQYPGLFRLFDVGNSWETQNGLAQRDLFVARISSSQGPAEKARLLVVAELHGREIITPEVALGFMDDLLRGYGEDATITWLLDHAEVWVMPMANPDGHARAVALESWRKNTRVTAECRHGVAPNSYGVDLNRNFGYQWGLDNLGSSPEPCNLTYRGRAAFSEPEAQALRDLVENQKFGLVISLHSYGDMVLYPWAYETAPAPHAAELEALAERMAVETGYMAMPATGIGYTANGDLADWVYGEQGIAAFTIEVGGMEDGFFWPGCNVKEALYNEVKPALMYAALAAGGPMEVAGGPEARQILLQVGEQEVGIRAQVSDRWTGGDRIARAEVFVADIGAVGRGEALEPIDGHPSSDSEWMRGWLSERVVMQYAGQRVPLLVVSEDERGKRGVPAAVWLDLREMAVEARERVQVWIGAGETPTYEIAGGYVYAGPAEAHEVLMTLEGERVYRGYGTGGEVLYTLRAGKVQVGEGGPVLHSRVANLIYRGEASGGEVLYEIDYTRLMRHGSHGEEAVVLMANVDLGSPSMETASLLLPVLIDRRY
jgi:hypothetical protein